jgi:CRISPR-associated protein Cas1
MPIFEKTPLETLTPAKDRWTPIYLEHGRLEVDDSSIKWIGADRLVYRLPVATLSAILLGPGTSVTHAAIAACANSNTPVCWIAEDGMRFYAFGITLTTTTLCRENTRVLGLTERGAPKSPVGCSHAASPALTCRHTR